MLRFELLLHCWNPTFTLYLRGASQGLHNADSCTCFLSQILFFFLNSIWLHEPVATLYQDYKPRNPVETFSLTLQICEHCFLVNWSLCKERSEEIRWARSLCLPKYNVTSLGDISRGSVLSVGRRREGTPKVYTTNSTPRMDPGSTNDLLTHLSKGVLCLLVCMHPYLCSSPKHPGFDISPRLHKPQCP